MKNENIIKKIFALDVEQQLRCGDVINNLLLFFSQMVKEIIPEMKTNYHDALSHENRTILPETSLGFNHCREEMLQKLEEIVK